MPRDRKLPGISIEDNMKKSQKKKYVSTGLSLLKINNPAFNKPVENKENNSPLVKTAKTKNSLKDRLLFSNNTAEGKPNLTKMAIPMKPPNVVIDVAPASIFKEMPKHSTQIQEWPKTCTSTPVHFKINPVKEKSILTKSVISPKSVVVIDGPPASKFQERLRTPTPVQVMQNTSTSLPVHFTINPVQGKPNTTKMAISMEPPKSVVVIDNTPASMSHERLKNPTLVQVSQNTSNSVPANFTIKPVQENLNMTKSVISMKPPKSVVVIDSAPASIFQEKLKNPPPVQVSQNTSTSVPVHFTIKPVQEKPDLTKSVISMKPPKSFVDIDGAPASKFQERLKDPPPIQEMQHTSSSVPVHFPSKSVEETQKITKSGTSMKPQKSLINNPPVPKYQERLKKFHQIQERSKNAFAPGHFSRREKRQQPSNSIQNKQKPTSSYQKKAKPANSPQERQKTLSSIHETPKPTNSSQNKSQLEHATNIQNHKFGHELGIESQPNNSMPILINEEVKIKEKSKNTYSYEERKKANNSCQERPPPLASYQEKGPKGVATPIDVPMGVAPPIGGATVSHGQPLKKIEPVGVAAPLKEDLPGPNKEAIDAREKAQRERKGNYCILNLLKKCNFENLWTISDICSRNCPQNSKSADFIKQS